MSGHKRNFAWLLLGNLVSALANWGIITTIARFGGAESVGTFAYGLAITTPIFLLADLQLRGLQAADSKGALSFRLLLSTRIVTTLAASVVALALVFLLSESPGTRAVTVLCAVGKSFDSFITLLHGHYQRRKRMLAIALTQALNGVASLGFCVVLMLWLGPSAINGALGYALGSVLSALAIWAASLAISDTRRELFTSNQVSVTFSGILGIVGVALPLGISAFLVSANQSILRYIIEDRADLASLGVFAALTYLLTPNTMAINAIGQSQLPSLADDYHQNPHSRFIARNLRLTGIVVALGGATALGALLFGGIALKLAYGEQFTEHSGLLLIFSLTTVFSNVTGLWNYSLLAKQHRKGQLLVALCGVVVTIVVGPALISSLGLRGAALVLALSAMAQIVVGAYHIFRIKATTNSKPSVEEGVAS